MSDLSFLKVVFVVLGECTGRLHIKFGSLFANFFYEWFDFWFFGDLE